MDVRERLQSSTDVPASGDPERGHELYVRGRRRRSRRLAAGAGGTVAVLLLAVAVLPGSGLLGDQGPGSPIVDDLASAPEPADVDPGPEPDADTTIEPATGPTVVDPWIGRALAGELATSEADEGAQPEAEAQAEAEPGTAPAATPEAPTTTAPAAESGTPRIDDAPSRDDRARDPAGEADLVLTDVRVWTHPGFDRVTIEFAGTGQAGWFTSLDDRAIEHGKGREFDVAGSSVLTVFANMLVFPPDAPAGIDQWDGATVSAPADAQVLTEVVSANWYEGQHQLFLGLREEVPYSIGRLDDPERIVIDLMHP